MERKIVKSFADKSPMEQYEFMMRKQMTKCLLCLEGKKIRNLLADHFLAEHSGKFSDK